MNENEAISIQGELEHNAIKERQYALAHVFNRTKNIFYEPTFHGNDWEQLYENYKKHLPYIGNDYEFSDMLSEVLGELNVSHSDARYSGDDVENKDETAALGIFMDYDYPGEGIKISEVIKGGPVDKVDFDIQPGTLISKIDNDTLSTNTDMARYLNRKADHFVLLELFDQKNKTQEIGVKPISLDQENTLLYKRFVRQNAKDVDRLSNGRLGYVHIPGMADDPYRSLYEGMMGKYADREGVVFDTRFNGGGDLVSDLAMFLTREKLLTYGTEEHDVGGEPYWHY